MKKLILAAALAAGISQAETICGKTYTTAAGLLVRVSCINVEQFRAWGVVVPPGLQSQTQLLIDVPDGRGVDVSLSGQLRMERAIMQQDGVRRALVSFDRIDHESLPEIEVLFAK